ncbi:MAG: hypothetical protein ACHREM_24520, partial [Polyangiales bacterium]
MNASTCLRAGALLFASSSMLACGGALTLPDTGDSATTTDSGTSDGTVSDTGTGSDASSDVAGDAVQD